MQKHYCALLIFFSCLQLRGVGQINLVPNPNFDSVDCRTLSLFEWRRDGFAPPFNYCFPLGFSPGPNLQLPRINPSPWSFSDCYQTPRSGGGFVGVAVSNDRGYVKATLKEELEQYKKYYARFYVNPYYPIFNWIKWPYSANVGMVVTDFDNGIAGNFNSYFNEKPVIENVKLLKDTMNWVKVSGAFNAKGGEKYVVIGNFRTNERSLIDYNGYVPNMSAYPPNIFFIEDVVVSKFDPLPDTAILCEGVPLVFDATFYDATYRWNDWSENAKLIVTKPGNYAVEAFIDGVTLQDEVQVVPEKGFQPLPKDTVVCEKGPPVVLRINADAQYKWSTGQTSKSIPVTNAGVYTVTVTTPQCSLQFSTDVTSRICDCNFFMPTAFSPNGDENNEGLKPFMQCKVVEVNSYRFSIFNRFGNLVFNTTDINAVWDGTFNGKKCVEDTYAWFVEYNTIIDGNRPYKRVVEKGDVVLMR
jgi:gliding motility-associated-like protein